MLQELWDAIRDKHGVAKFQPVIIEPLEDDASEAVVDSPGPPVGSLQQVSGFTCIIAYCNAKGIPSQRQVTCIRLEQAGQSQYLRAYCHMRRERRQFKLERIDAIADVHTAEIISEDAPDFFSHFAFKHHQRSKMGWGISVQCRADLLAGINALVFMARCDQEYHPAEQAAIEKFVSSYWLRGELPGEPPMNDILAHAARISPDSEVFYVALTRCSERLELAPIIRRAIQGVVEADGRIHDKEFYWGNAVDDYFRSLTT